MLTHSLVLSLLLSGMAYSAESTKPASKEIQKVEKEAPKHKKKPKLKKKEDQISHEKNADHKKHRKARLGKALKRAKGQEATEKTGNNAELP